MAERRGGGGRGQKNLICLQKHAIINFFACDRLEQVLGRQIQESGAAETGGKKNRKNQGDYHKRLAPKFAF